MVCSVAPVRGTGGPRLRVFDPASGPQTGVSVVILADRRCAAAGSGIEQALASVHRRFRRCEVLVVGPGADTDGLGGGRIPVRVVRRRVDERAGGALHRAFRAARYDTVLMVPSRAHACSELWLRVLERMDECDLAVCDRDARPGWWRRALGAIEATATGLLWGVRCPDVHGVRAVRKWVIDELPPRSWVWLLDLALLHRAATLDARVSHVTFSRPRAARRGAHRDHGRRRVGGLLDCARWMIS